ncbi:nucleolar protein 11 isoform X1 [Phascolarctos cinereus]|uniref:Nucleolar protein 11 isoform X1 n=1 Tax=Phascolarctos cinereus TaxID=38626 RepID=A0A6P5LFA3_PHACI|nr:nucleolar protein 11 isoform X1 [Phascolarctos cinereus]
MAVLEEDFTLGGLVPGAGLDGLLGVEHGQKADLFLVTDRGRTVILYKVSDQKPLGCWSVKQGQTITCPAVCNFQTGEYVVVHDDKVLRIWKNEDVNLDKVFKATLSADVYRIHSVQNTEPLVLFREGAVRRLDALLAEPQQEIEAVISDEEVIKWTKLFLDSNQPVLIFVTEKHGNYFVYVQVFNPRNLCKYTLLRGEEEPVTLSFAASVNERLVTLLCLSCNGSIYETLIPLNQSKPEEKQVLVTSLLLKTNVSGSVLKGVSLAILDKDHVAVMGTSLKAPKESISVWNIKFQTLQTSKELSQGTGGQLWCYGGKLFMLHGKFLTVIPFKCEISSLAAALGKLKNIQAPGTQTVSHFVNWGTFQGDGLESQDSNNLVPLKGQSKRSSRTRRNETRSQLEDSTNKEFLSGVKDASEKHLEQQLSKFLADKRTPEFQITVGHIVTELVERCKAEPAFYPQSSLAQLVQTQGLSYSLCPDLMAVALEKRDVRLLQLCLQQFPDIPESVTCACLKVFLSIGDDSLQETNVNMDSVIGYLNFAQDEKMGKTEVVQNGFSPVLLEENNFDDKLNKLDDTMNTTLTCPVTPQKAALLNAILHSAYSETFLLSNLKDLTVQHVILFLQYLHFLYEKCSENASMTLPGPCPPTLNQIMDWICLLLDAHFTVVVMIPEAKGILASLYKFVKAQVWVYSELNKIEGSLQQLQKLHQQRNMGLYSIEVLELI